MLSRKLAPAGVMFFVCFVDANSVLAQSAPKLLWNGDGASIVTGYAVTIDGARTNLGLAPIPTGGVCGCSTPLTLNGGQHTIVVTAYNSVGETPSAPLVVQPVANPGGPYSAQTGTAIAVNGSGSIAPTGTLTNYIWRWGDGTTDTSSSVSSASHTYSTAGTFTLTLTVRDNAGATASATTSVTVSGALPGTPTSPNPANGATSVATNATLTWTATGATSYNVSFGTANPPPQVTTGQASASYQPAGMVAGTTYYWRVTARNSAGTSTGPVWSFTTASSSTLPAPWQTQDVGSVGLGGSASHSGGQLTLAGAGADIGGTADGFRYAYLQLSGDVQIIARMTGIQNTHQNAKAGVMIRESLSANARHALVSARPDSGIELLFRTSSGGTTASGGVTTQALPAWLRLARTGNMIVAAVSADGSTWSVVGSANVPMAAAVFVGMAVTSHNVTALNTSKFDSISVTTGSGTQPPATPTSPTPLNGATAVATNAMLTWSALGATSYDVSFGTTNPPPQITTAQSTASYPPGATTGGTTYYWRIVARNSGGTTTGPVWSYTTATPPTGGTVPALWLNQDVGAVGQFGTASYSAGPPSTFTIEGSGADIWGTTDAFHYLHQPLNNNTEIIARVVSLENTHSYAKAGIMIRADLDAGSAHVVLDVRPNGSVEFLARPNQGATTVSVASALQSPPAWLKLVRAGSIVTGYVSSNGSTWTQVGSTSAALGPSPCAGLAVTSHDTAALNTAVFDSVSLAAGPGIPYPNSFGDVVIYASDVPAAARHGSWQIASDSLSPNSVKLTTPDNGFVSANLPVANPQHYVDVAFQADAGKSYRLWLRLRSRLNRKANDSVWVQFSDALMGGSPAYRINTTAGLLVNLATNSSASSLFNWGWQNGAYWLSQPTAVKFASTGMHTIRIQVREDGVELDQIVLSPTTYINASPGPVSNDTTIVPK